MTLCLSLFRIPRSRLLLFGLAAVHSRKHQVNDPFGQCVIKWFIQQQKADIEDADVRLEEQLEICL